MSDSEEKADSCENIHGSTEVHEISSCTDSSNTSDSQVWSMCGIEGNSHIDLRDITPSISPVPFTDDQVRQLHRNQLHMDGVDMLAEDSFLSHDPVKQIDEVYHSSRGELLLETTSYDSLPSDVMSMSFSDIGMHYPLKHEHDVMLNNPDLKLDLPSMFPSLDAIEAPVKDEMQECTDKQDLSPEHVIGDAPRDKESVDKHDDEDSDKEDGLDGSVGNSGDTNPHTLRRSPRKMVNTEGNDSIVSKQTGKSSRKGRLSGTTVEPVKRDLRRSTRAQHKETEESPKTPGTRGKKGEIKKNESKSSDDSENKDSKSVRRSPRSSLKGEENNDSKVKKGHQTRGKGKLKKNDETKESPQDKSPQDKEESDKITKCESSEEDKKVFISSKKLDFSETEKKSGEDNKPEKETEQGKTKEQTEVKKTKPVQELNSPTRVTRRSTRIKHEDVQEENKTNEKTSGKEKLENETKDVIVKGKIKEKHAGDEKKSEGSKVENASTVEKMENKDEDEDEEKSLKELMEEEKKKVHKKNEKNVEQNEKVQKRKVVVKPKEEDLSKEDNKNKKPKEKKETGLKTKTEDITKKDEKQVKKETHKEEKSISVVHNDEKPKQIAEKVHIEKKEVEKKDEVRKERRGSLKIKEKVKQTGNEKEKNIRRESTDSTEVKSPKRKVIVKRKDSEGTSGNEHESGEEFVDNEGDSDYDPDNDPDRLWCICKKPHGNRFMICCDQCQEWFHGDCVGVTKAKGREMEKKGLEYNCPKCIKQVEEKGKEVVKLKRKKRKSPKKMINLDSKDDDEEETLKPETLFAPDKIVRKDQRRFSKDGGEMSPSEKKHEDPRKIMDRRKTESELKSSEEKTKEGDIKRRRSSEPTDFKIPKKVRTTPTPASHTSHSPLKRCMVKGCNKYASKGSIYCSNECIVRYSEETLHTLAEERRKRMGIKSPTHRKSSSMSSHVDSNERVTVIERATGKIIAGMAAPPEDRLADWLERHPSFEVYRPGRGITHPTPNISHTHTSTGVTNKSSNTGHASSSFYSANAVNKEKKEAKVKDDTETVRINVKRHLKEILDQRCKESDDMRMTIEHIMSCANDVEGQLFKMFGDSGHRYKAKYRSLTFNLRDSRNKHLFRHVLNGQIPPDKLVHMTSEQLASPELAQWREWENKHNLDMIKEQQEEMNKKTNIKKTHKGEIEIDDADLSTLESHLEKEHPDLQCSADEEAKNSGLLIDTTEEHRAHLFDLNCKICTGKVVPPGEDLVKEKTALVPPVVPMTIQAIAESSVPSPPPLDVSIPSPDSVSTTITLSPPRGLHSKRKVPAVWKGFVMMQNVAKFGTSAYGVSGPSDDLLQILPDTLHIHGRISFEQVWDYVFQIRSSSTRELCVVRYEAAADEEKMSYVSLYSYFYSRRRCGVIGNVASGVKDMYLVPLASHQPIPQELQPFDGPGLEEPRPHMLLGLIVRTKQSILKHPRPTKQTSTTPTEIPVKQPVAKTSSETKSSSHKSSTTPPDSPLADIDDIVFQYNATVGKKPSSDDYSPSSSVSTLSISTPQPQYNPSPIASQIPTYNPSPVTSANSSTSNTSSTASPVPLGDPMAQLQMQKDQLSNLQSITKQYLGHKEDNQHSGQSELTQSGDSKTGQNDDDDPYDPEEGIVLDEIEEEDTPSIPPLAVSTDSKIIPPAALTIAGLSSLPMFLLPPIITPISQAQAYSPSQSPVVNLDDGGAGTVASPTQHPRASSSTVHSTVKIPQKLQDQSSVPELPKELESLINQANSSGQKQDPKTNTGTHSPIDPRKRRGNNKDNKADPGPPKKFKHDPLESSTEKQLVTRTLQDQGGAENSPLQGGSPHDTPSNSRDNDHGRPSYTVPSLDRSQTESFHNRPPHPSSGADRPPHDRTSHTTLGRPPHVEPDHTRPLLDRPPHVDPTHGRLPHERPPHGGPGHDRPLLERPPHNDPGHARLSHERPTHGGADHERSLLGRPPYAGPDHVRPVLDRPPHVDPGHVRLQHERPPHGGPSIHERPPHVQSLDRPPHTGPGHLDRPPHGGPGHERPFQDRPPHPGPEHERPVLDRPPHSGPNHDRPLQERPPLAGPGQDRPPHPTIRSLVTLPPHSAVGRREGIPAVSGEHNRHHGQAEGLRDARPTGTHGPLETGHREERRNSNEADPRRRGSNENRERESWHDRDRDSWQQRQQHSDPSLMQERSWRERDDRDRRREDERRWEYERHHTHSGRGHQEGEMHARNRDRTRHDNRGEHRWRKY